jgi:hypothetical protein
VKAGQCVLLTEQRAFEFDGTHTWADNLLIRLVPGSGAGRDREPVAILVGAAMQTVWLTNITFQGDRAAGAEQPSRGLGTEDQAEVYCGGVQSPLACWQLHHR